MWSKLKQDEKDEHYQYLKERVSIQHELIRRQDILFKNRQAKIEQKRWQVWWSVASIFYLSSGFWYHKWFLNMNWNNFYYTIPTLVLIFILVLVFDVTNDF